MEAYQERVIAEMKDLDDKIGKLSAFMKLDTFQGLEEEDRNLLTEQYEHMNQYYSVLRKRVERFG